MLRIGAELRCNPKVTHFDLMNGTRERGGSEALGLVDRLPDDRDRRVKKLVRTAKGATRSALLDPEVLATSPALVPLDGPVESNSWSCCVNSAARPIAHADLRRLRTLGPRPPTTRPGCHGLPAGRNSVLRAAGLLVM